MNTEMKELTDRISAAKKYLTGEMTCLKTQKGEANFSLREISYHMDTIHEVERLGIRKLTDMDFIKINRTLTSVEACMKLSHN